MRFRLSHLAKRVFPRGIDYLPDPPREIKPHPYGIELGMLMKMLQDTQSHWLSGFLRSRVLTDHEALAKAAESGSDVAMDAVINGEKHASEAFGGPTSTGRKSRFRTFTQTGTWVRGCGCGIAI